MASEIALALKKQRLQFRSAALRQALAEDLVPLAPVFMTMDRVSEGIAFLKARPQWLVGAVVALAVARPGRLWRWFRRGIGLWQVWRRARPFLQRFGIRP